MVVLLTMVLGNRDIGVFLRGPGDNKHGGEEISGKLLVPSVRLERTTYRLGGGL